jgi:hypothetical protein
MITEIFWLLTWPILIAASFFAITVVLKKYEQHQEKK